MPATIEKVTTRPRNQRAEVRGGRAYSVLTVHASDTIRDAGGQYIQGLRWGHAAVELTKGDTEGLPYVSLVLASEPALKSFDRSTSVNFEVRHPDAIRALANALLALLADPTAKEILASIQPDGEP
jgi:hypothetical protein